MTPDQSNRFFVTHCIVYFFVLNMFYAYIILIILIFVVLQKINLYLFQYVKKNEKFF